jgi:hypothetical protein
MSLLRLLTAGRCWVGSKPMMGRYKFSDPRSMPKFGLGPNPFKGKEKTISGRQSENAPSGAGEPQVEAEAEKVLKSAEGVAGVEVVESGKHSDETARSDRPEDLSEIAEPAEGAEQKLPSASAKIEEQEKEGVQEKEIAVVQKAISRPEKAPGWISKVSSLTSSLRMKLWKPRPSATPPRPVQGELSLDNIKPVRNDLSETDLEVVPLRTSAIVKAKAKARTRAAGVEPEAAQVQPADPPQGQDLIEAGRT